MSELYPNSYQIPAMLVSKTPKDVSEKLASGDYIGTEKMDGAWYQAEKTDDGSTYLFGRSKSKKTGELAEKSANFPHIMAWIAGLPKNTILIGEIYKPGGKSNDVTKISGCLPKKAYERQFEDKSGNYEPLHYYIHDIIMFGNKDLSNESYIERLIYLQNAIAPQIDSEYIEIAEPVYKNLEQALQEVFDKGGEGMVFRHKDSVYEPGKRPKTVFKIKTEETFDAVIMGFVDPEKYYTGKDADNWPYVEDLNGKLYHLEDGVRIKTPTRPVTKAYYNGWKAGINVGAFDNDGVLHSVGTISSGMTDFLREDMAKNPDKYLNKVVEIQAMSVDPKEQTIRHGRLMRVRDDKNAEECTLNSIFGK